jgi:[ribosomal protein S5]-alanine N-acetyltransferase
VEIVSPILTTRRLSLRRLTPADAPFIMELMNERPYIDNIGDRGVRSVSDATFYIDSKYTPSYERHGYGFYVVTLEEDSVPVGICGLVKRDTLEHPDLGFAYLQRFWSLGFAVEAASAVLAYARDTLNLPYLYAVVSPRNDRSIRLLAHLGLNYVRSLLLTGQVSEIHVYGKELNAKRRDSAP